MNLGQGKKLEHGGCLDLLYLDDIISHLEAKAKQAAFRRAFEQRALLLRIEDAEMARADQQGVIRAGALLEPHVMQFLDKLDVAEFVRTMQAQRSQTLPSWLLARPHQDAFEQAFGGGLALRRGLVHPRRETDEAAKD